MLLQLVHVVCPVMSLLPCSWTTLNLVYCGVTAPAVAHLHTLARPSPPHRRRRGQAIALATLTNFGSNFLVSLLLPSIQETFGPAGEAARCSWMAARGAVLLLARPPAAWWAGSLPAFLYMSSPARYTLSLRQH